MSERAIRQARRAALPDEGARATLLALAFFADADGAVRDGVVEALQDGRLRLTVGVATDGRRILYIDSAAGRVAEIDFTPGAPMPRRHLPGLPS